MAGSMLPSRSTRSASSRRAAPLLLCRPAAGSPRARAANAFGKHPRERERDVAAHRMTDQRGALDAERVERRRNVGCKPFHEIRTVGRARRSSAAQVRYEPRTTIARAPPLALPKSRSSTESHGSARLPGHVFVRRRVRRCTRRHRQKLALSRVILYKVGNTPGRLPTRERMTRTNNGSQRKKAARKTRR